MWSVAFVPLHREFLRSWCTDTSRLDPGAGVEPPVPLNGGSLGMRATFPSVYDHNLFSRCSKQRRSEHCGCLWCWGQKEKCFLGFQCGCDVNLILVFKLCWLSIIKGGEEAKTFSCSSAKSNLAGEITLNLDSGWTELRCWGLLFCPQKVTLCWFKLASPFWKSVSKMHQILIDLILLCKWSSGWAGLWH